MKVMINVPDEMLAKLDYHAKKKYKTRSGFLQDLIYSYINEYDYIEAIKELRVFCENNKKVASYSNEIAAEFKDLVKRLRI